MYLYFPIFFASHTRHVSKPLYTLIKLSPCLLFPYGPRVSCGCPNLRSYDLYLVYRTVYDVIFIIATSFLSASPSGRGVVHLDPRPHASHNHLHPKKPSITLMRSCGYSFRLDHVVAQHLFRPLGEPCHHFHRDAVPHETNCLAWRRCDPVMCSPVMPHTRDPMLNKEEHLRARWVLLSALNLRRGECCQRSTSEALPAQPPTQAVRVAWHCARIARVTVSGSVGVPHLSSHGRTKAHAHARTAVFRTRACIVPHCRVGEYHPPGGLACDPHLH